MSRHTLASKASHIDSLSQGKSLSGRLSFTLTLHDQIEKVHLDKVVDFCRQHNFSLERISHDNRNVRISGAADKINAAFGIQLKSYQHNGKDFHGHAEAVKIPESLRSVVNGVVGLSSRPVAKPYFHRVPKASARDVQQQGYNPTDIAALYNFPASTGAGQSIAIIELGGGFQQDDLVNYFQTINVPLPNVVAVSVDGAVSSPSTPDSADGEVMLDIEVAGGVAPGANIVVYFTNNTDSGFYDAIMAAVNDTHYAPKIISISWGGPENEWDPNSITSLNSAFAVCVQKGISVFVAAGDNGFTDGEGGKTAHVDFPGSSPNVTCCGGTYIQSANGKITSETVWNDDPQQSATGGGISLVFPVPSYQNGVKMPPELNTKQTGRGVPDVASVSDPNSGYNILVDGEYAVIGGTSSAAPLWAGLTARLNDLLGKPLGFLNPLIYQASVEKCFNDIVQGNNGGYSACVGYDCCTGWGSPNGAALLAAFKAQMAPPAPVPSKPSPTPAPSGATVLGAKPAPAPVVKAPAQNPNQQAFLHL